MKGLRPRRAVAGIVVVAAAVIALGGTAIAAMQVTSVPTYTGCLTNSGGTVSLIKQGSSPQKPCGSGSTQIQLSGGDITSITVGSGLTGGGTQGDINIGLSA